MLFNLIMRLDSNIVLYCNFAFIFRKKKKDKQKEKLKEAVEQEQQMAVSEGPISTKTKAEIAFEKRKWKKVNTASVPAYCSIDRHDTCWIPEYIQH